MLFDLLFIKFYIVLHFKWACAQGAVTIELNKVTMLLIVCFFEVLHAFIHKNLTLISLSEAKSVPRTLVELERVET